MLPLPIPMQVSCPHCGTPNLTHPSPHQDQGFIPQAVPVNAQLQSPPPQQYNHQTQFVQQPQPALYPGGSYPQQQQQQQQQQLYNNNIQPDPVVATELAGEFEIASSQQPGPLN